MRGANEAVTRPRALVLNGIHCRCQPSLQREDPTTRLLARGTAIVPDLSYLGRARSWRKKNAAFTPTQQVLQSQI